MLRSIKLQSFQCFLNLNPKGKVGNKSRTQDSWHNFSYWSVSWCQKKALRNRRNTDHSLWHKKKMFAEPIYFKCVFSESEVNRNRVWGYCDRLVAWKMISPEDMWSRFIRERRAEWERCMQNSTEWSSHSERVGQEQRLINRSVQSKKYIWYLILQ